MLWFDDEATGGVVLELRATDRIGMLHRVAAALEECDAQVSVGAGGDARASSVVDSFGLAVPAGRGDAPTRRERRRGMRVRAVLAARR